MSIFATLLFTNVSNNVRMNLNACEHAGLTMTNVQSIVLVMQNALVVVLIDMMAIHARLGIVKTKNHLKNTVQHHMRAIENHAHMNLNPNAAQIQIAVGSHILEVAVMNHGVFIPKSY